jgi:hypothetical protein
MTREDKYMLCCLHAINLARGKWSTQVAVKVDGKWETITWDEVAEWIEAQYEIEGSKE